MTAPLFAATAGVNRSRPATLGSTIRGALHVCPPSAETDNTMSLSPAGLNLVSCQTTYILPVTGSMAAAGSPPVRMPGTPEPRNWPMVTGLLHVRPPSCEVCAVSKSLFVFGSVRSYTTVTEPSGWTSGIRPSVSAVGALMNRSGDHVLPWLSEKLTAPGEWTTAFCPEPVWMNLDHTV